MINCKFISTPIRYCQTLSTATATTTSTTNLFVTGLVSVMSPRCHIATMNRYGRAMSVFVSPSSSALSRMLQQQNCYYRTTTKTSQRYMSSSSSSSSSIVEDVTNDMKVAMKSKDATTLATIRLIRTAFANMAIELRTESLTNEQAITALRKMAKMRKESIEMYETNGAMDRADVERIELQVIEKYLPPSVSDDTVRIWVQDAIQEIGSYDNIGKVMGAFMKKHKSDVDGSIAQRILKEEIEKMKQA